MKKFFYSFLLLFVSAAVFAQAPGGVSGSVLWLKANSGVTASTWTDFSGMGNDFSQPTPANMPTLTSSLYNFYEGLEFDGASSFLVQPTPTGFPAGNADRTIIVVATAALTNSYRWIFVYGSPSLAVPDVTCQMGNFDGKLANAYFGSSADMLTLSSYWDMAENSNGALASFTLNSNVETQYNSGLPINSQTVTATLTATSVQGIIGALKPTLEQAWWGSIGEILVFNSALSTADRNRVEAYLALKYGFTLGTTASPVDYVASDGTTIYWTGSATYQNNVFGIGTDLGSDIVQTISNSINTGSGDGTGQGGKGNIVLSTGTTLANKQFLMIGDDGGALTEHVILAGEAPTKAVGSTRVLRNWKVQNTGSVGTVDLSIDINGLLLTGTTFNDYRLMVDQDGDGDYTTGTVYLTPIDLTGGLLSFSGITLANNSVLTLVSQATALLLPATWEGFTVNLQKNKATLTWKTSSEINVDHYTVEYSSNGITYLTAGTVAAKNSAGLNTYTLVQENLPAGIRYYRIKRVDKDGKFQLSEVKSVRAGGLTTVAIRTNPIVKGVLELTIDVPQNQAAVIRILSTSGKVIVQQNTGLSTGTNNIRTNMAHAAAGTYFLQVQLANEVINKKFIRL